MRILITNDDGIDAKGINVLFSVLSASHDVYMIAPSEERSACSNAITMRAPVTLKKYDSHRFSITGFPADCVNVGLHGNVIPEPDIIISGINHGANLGDDIYYSGTVAGARVSRINGKSGIALSLCSKESFSQLGDVAHFMLRYLSNSENLFLAESILLNINYPALSPEEIRGISYTYLDKRRYVDHYVSVNNSDSTSSIKLEGIVESEKRSGSDADMIDKGFVSITPLDLDSTDYGMLEKFSKIGEMVS